MPTQQEIKVKAGRMRNALRDEAKYLGPDDGNYKPIMKLVDADDSSLSRLYDLIQKYGTKGAALSAIEHGKEAALG